MSLHTSKLADFKGFALCYDVKTKPFFKGQVLEDLRKIASVAIGRELLKGIADARPRIRKRPTNDAFKGITFPSGVNVVITPTDLNSERIFTQPGIANVMGNLVKSDQPQHNLTNAEGKSFCHFKGGSVAMGVDDNAKGDGRGCVSVVRFTNAQVITSKGEPAPSFVVFAHELIHSLHHVTGTTHANDEEVKTTGIGNYDKLTMTENGFRASFGIKRRMAY